MTITIITVTFNSQDTLRDTLDSILHQSYPYIEHILIDGLSQDNTLQIANDYQKLFIQKGISSQIISEKDNGIYDAMNKGIRYASGDIIGFLNSDDFLASPQSLFLIAQAFASSNSDCVFGQLALIDQNKQIKRIWLDGGYSPLAFIFGWHPAHPTFYVKKKIFDQFGVFDIRYKIASDYDLMLRFLYKHKISSTYIPQNLVKMRLGGTSNANFSNIFKANLECFKAWQNNTLCSFPIFIIFKPIRKVFSTIKQMVSPSPKNKLKILGVA